MSAVTPFILERIAGNAGATARVEQAQVELLKEQHKLLKEILKILKGKTPK